MSLAAGVPLAAALVTRPATLRPTGLELAYISSTEVTPAVLIPLERVPTHHPSSAHDLDVAHCAPHCVLHSSSPNPVHGLPFIHTV